MLDRTQLVAQKILESCKNKNKKSNKCITCYSISNRKVERPTLGQLLDDVENLGYVGTGSKYGVSDNSIRKWIKGYRK